MSIDVSKLRAIVEADTLTAEERLARVSAEFDRMGKTAYTAAEKSRAFNDVAGQVAIAGAAIGAAGIAAGAGLFNAASKAEQTQIAFTTMLGSGEKATAMLDELRAFAATTPFEFNDLTVASQRLMAMGVAARDVIPMMTDVGDAVAGLGAGNEGIERVTRAFGQMLTRGKTSAQDMLQLTEVGIPAWRYLADAIGVTTGKVQEMSEQGLIPAGVAIDAIRAGMQADFGGLMAQQAQTASGQLSNLKDSADKLAATWGQTLLPAAKDVIGGLQGVADALNALPPANRETVVTVGGTVTAIGALAGGAAAAIPQVQKLGESMLTLSGAGKVTAGASLAAGGAVAAAAVSWAVAIGMVVDTNGKVQQGIADVNTALAQHETDIRASAGGYADYRVEIERAAKAAGYFVDAQGNLSRIVITGAGATIELVQANYALTQSQFDAIRTAKNLGDTLREDRAEMLQLKGAAQQGAEGMQIMESATEKNKREQKAFQDQVDGLNRLVSGEVGRVTDDYIAQQAELRVKARDLTSELEKLEAQQGKQYTITKESALSANELNLAQLKLADAQRKLGEETDPLKQAQLQVEIDKLTAKMAGAASVTSGFVDNGKRIGEIKGELENVNGALDTNAAKYEDSMKRIAFAMLQERLAADGWQEGDMTMLAEVGVAWGIFDQKTADTLNNVNKALNESGGEVEVFLSKMGYVYNLPNKTIKINVETSLAATTGEDFGGWTAPKTKGKGATTTTGAGDVEDGIKIGGANGLDMIVPPGYPNDSFPVWAQSGERVTITPPGQFSGGAAGASVTINVSGVQDPEAAANIVVQKLQDRGMISPAALR